MNKRDITKFRKSYKPWKADCVSEGLKLAVHFDEKELVKKMGARWEPDPSGKGGYWWMPEKNLKNDAHPNGSLVVDVLNDEQMIIGPMGKINITPKLAKSTDNYESTNYHLVNPQEGGKTLGTFYVYEELQIAKWVTSTTEKWVVLEEARTTWNELMEAGFRQVLQETS
ncbi:hypothetical protein CL614_01865 [archaeon]|nr:hypothetical protein [archaeon]|tara:strand:- start:2369 stop:2875 length:507 start_codon:yes stop_codon:yes gene_type:complete